MKIIRLLSVLLLAGQSASAQIPSLAQFMAATALSVVTMPDGEGADPAPIHDDSEIPVFKVTRETPKAVDGVIPPDADRVDPKRELQLIQTGAQWVYQEIPAFQRHLERLGGEENLRKAKLIGYLRQSMPKTHYRANHTIAHRKVYMGWSSEDDPEYVFGDNSTVKVNLSEKMVRLLDFGQRLFSGEFGADYAADPSLRQGFNNMVATFYIHESLHAHQYLTDPAYDYSRYYADRCKEIDCDNPKEVAAVMDEMIDGNVHARGKKFDLLAETKKKINYERDAFGLHRMFGTHFGQAQDYYNLAKAIRAIAKANPAMFAEGGELRLLSPEVRNSVVARYLEDDPKTLNLGRNLEGKAQIVYEGQYVPMEVFRAVTEIHAAVTDPKRGPAAALAVQDRYGDLFETFAGISGQEAEAFDNIPDMVAALQAGMNHFSQSPMRKSLIDMNPALPAMEKRLYKLYEEIEKAG